MFVVAYLLWRSQIRPLPEFRVTKRGAWLTMFAAPYAGGIVSARSPMRAEFLARLGDAQLPPHVVTLFVSFEQVLRR